MMDLSGRTLGQYEILAQMGQIGMATVCRAELSTSPPTPPDGLAMDAGESDEPAFTPAEAAPDGGPEPVIPPPPPGPAGQPAPPDPGGRVPAWLWVSGCLTGLIFCAALAAAALLLTRVINLGSIGAPPVEEAAELIVEETGGTLTTAVFAWPQEFDTLNPLYTNLWSTAITSDIWNCSAWVFDDSMTPVPVLVTEIPSLENAGISRDGRTITLTLRDDIYWQDGEPITARDFLFTYEMATDPSNTVWWYPYNQAENVEAVDDRTIRMTFDQPFAPWLAEFWRGLLPEHILAPVYAAEGTIDMAEWNLAPTVGCGPFQFDEWEPGSYARFVAWDDYWLGRPNIDEIILRFVSDDRVSNMALINGEADLGMWFAYSDVPTLEQAGIEIIPVNAGYNEGLLINMDPELQHPALADQRVRQAITVAIDRDAIADLLLGLTYVAETPWEGSPYQDPYLDRYQYDPSMARNLLEAAGWRDQDGDGIREDGQGIELVLTYGTNTRQVRQDVQALVQQDLLDVGIGVELLTYDTDIYFATYGEGGPCARGELDLFEYSSAYNFPDPERISFTCSEVPSDRLPDGYNDQHLCDPHLDALFAEQRTLMDPAARTEVFHEISRYMYEQAYWIGLWYDPDLFGVRNTFTGVRISGADPFFNIYEWDIAD